MRSLLDHQADGIEYTLHSHSIDASVVGGNVSPRLIQFHIKLGSGVKYSRVAGLADELALALGVTHCRVTRDGHFVKIEVPRPDPVAVRLFPLMRTLPGDLPENAPILGLDEDGVPLLLRLESPDIAHVLISGTTGSGKTALARSMISSLALQNPPDSLRLLLIDPKGRGYRQFSGLPNLVCPVVTDPLDAIHRLKWVVRHMEKRDEQGLSRPMLVVFIDELADLVMMGGREIETLVTRLTQRGREAGIHIVACTQKPASSVIGGLAKSNFPTRIVGRVVSPEDAKVASGVAGSGAERLMGKGDFLLFSGGEITRLQGAHISPEEMEQTVIHLGGSPEIEQPKVGSRVKKRTTDEDYYQQAANDKRGRRSTRSQVDDDDGWMGVAEHAERYQSKRSRASEESRPASRSSRKAADTWDDYADEDDQPPAPVRPKSARREEAGPIDETNTEEFLNSVRLQALSLRKNNSR